jgi:hypothetical protein
MRYTTKRDGKNVIPLLNAACGIDMPYWRIDRADDLHRYLSGDAADKLAAYENAEEQGLLVRLPCKVGDMVYEVDVKRMEWGWIKVIEPVKFRIGMTDSVGKTVFLTCAEAEAALKGETEDV